MTCNGITPLILDQIVNYLGLPLPEKPGYQIRNEQGECVLTGTVYQPAPLLAGACLAEVKIPLGKSSIYPSQPFSFYSFEASRGSASFCAALSPVRVSDAKIASLVTALAKTELTEFPFVAPLTPTQEGESRELVKLFSYALATRRIASASLINPYEKL